MGSHLAAGAFPTFKVFDRALRLEVMRAATAAAADTSRLLHAIIGGAQEGAPSVALLLHRAKFAGEPPGADPAYALADARLRGHFAAAAPP